MNEKFPGVWYLSGDGRVMPCGVQGLKIRTSGKHYSTPL